jgi:hypothetical protein
MSCLHTTHLYFSSLLRAIGLNFINTAATSVVARGEILILEGRQLDSVEFVLFVVQFLFRFVHRGSQQGDTILFPGVVPKYRPGPARPSPARVTGPGRVLYRAHFYMSVFRQDCRH